MSEEDYFRPPMRDESGHRISVVPGYRPIATRHLPWQWKLAEYPMRWLARAAVRSDDPRMVTGEEPEPGHHRGINPDERTL